MGRPALYSPELGQELCDRISQGNSLRKVCDADDMPAWTTVFKWLRIDNTFAQQYAQARELWADAEFDRMMEIADTVREGQKVKTLPDGTKEVTTGDMVDRAKLQVDTRKWALARMMPRKYGDRMTQELTGAGGKELVVTIRSVLDEPPKVE